MSNANQFHSESIQLASKNAGKLKQLLGQNKKETETKGTVYPWVFILSYYIFL